MIRRALVGAHGVLVVLALLTPQGAMAQGTPPNTGAVSVRPDTTDPLTRALEAEDRSAWPVAIAAYREAIDRQLQLPSPDGERLALGMLGLERVAAEAGQLDAIVTTIDGVVARRPGDPTVRAVQLRTLTTLARDVDARTAFEQWRRAANGDAAPYREYARLLLQQGRALAADSLLKEAAQRLGAGTAFVGEAAQLHVALQRWGAAAAAFREAFADQPWLETAALFALQRTPPTARDSVRQQLVASPPRLAAARVLANLEMAWGEPRRAWNVLGAVPVNDSTVAAWHDFAERAELGESWLVARDAWRAVVDRAPTLDAMRRAAQAALRAGDAAGALALVRTTVRAPSGSAADSMARRSAAMTQRAMLAIEIEALGDLGRVQEAQQRLDRLRSELDDDTRRVLARPLVGAWLRAGDLSRARAAMAGTDLEDDDELVGWMALYEGDLVLARKHLVRASTRRTELVDALGILARVRIERSTALGAAFLTVARRDSSSASRQFAQLADSVGSAAPALLAMAARLAPSGTALAVWEQVITAHPRSPEAPEALLALARLHRDRRDQDRAITRLEQLLIEYPTSALAPQARRELDRLKGQVPPAGR